jgi:imidazoleglycerol-phosphate dehydratase
MRWAELNRSTLETNVSVKLELDQNKPVAVNCGIAFLDHMLTLFATHGAFGLAVTGSGDIQVDDHHLTEDLGLTIGKAFNIALGDRSGIGRYGCAIIPMDEALIRMVVDISGRPFFQSQYRFPAEKVGTFDTELVNEFLRGFSLAAGITIHLDILAGMNTHHIIEAIFKALGRAMKEAVRKTGDIIPSTKGIIEEGSD